MSARRNREHPLALVVDDDLAIRILAREALEGAGFDVEEADDGQTGVFSFERAEPDIILLDVIMQEMDGFTACMRIRALPGGSDIPVVMMTGVNDVASIERAYEAGATDFAIKPVNWTILIHRIRYLIRASKSFDALRRNELRLASAEHIAGLGNWEMTSDGGEMLCSVEFASILGLPPDTERLSLSEMVNRVHADDRSLLQDGLAGVLMSGIPMDIVHRIVMDDGSLRHLHHKAVTVHDSDRDPLLMGTVHDVTAQRLADERIRHLAYFDQLTSLANRTSLVETLQNKLKYAERAGILMALLFIDLDDFKRINDVYGHQLGDDLLCAVATRIRSVIRGEDDLQYPRLQQAKDKLIARFGGDEFLILLQHIGSIHDVSNIAHRILKVLSTPFESHERSIYVSASIGIAMYPNDGLSADDLIKNADLAMYEAKGKGKDRVCFFEEKMNIAVSNRLALETKFRVSLTNNEFEVYYQPKWDVGTGRIKGVEALSRWIIAGRQHASPAEFIPMAEETGLILKLDEWLMGTAFAQGMRWQSSGFDNIVIAVNCSNKHFHQQDMVRGISDLMTRTGFPPERLELEITEGTLMQPDSVKTLHKLKDMGISISIDDFGTGYSSFSYLRKLPLDRIKIDRSFISDLTLYPDAEAIVQAIIIMAHSLHLKVTAEGVETQEQLEFLRQHGCDEIQGYLLGRPMPAKEVEKVLIQGSSLTASHKV